MDGNAFAMKKFIFYLYIPEKKNIHTKLFAQRVRVFEAENEQHVRSTRSATCGCVLFSSLPRKWYDRLTLFTYVGKHNFDLINCLVQRG